MTEAYAIKGPDGQLYLTTGLGMSQEDAWYNFVESERHPDDNISDQERNERIAEAKLSANTCVQVTVSEKGEADEPPMMDLGDYYGIQVGPFVYMQRKTIQTATDAPMEDYEKAILNLCAYLSRRQG